MSTEKFDPQARENVLFSIYGVKLLGSYDKKSKRVSKNSVLELFEQDYNRYKNKGKTQLLDLYKKYSYAIFYMYVPSSIKNNLVYFKNIIKDNGGRYQQDALNAFDVEGVYAPIRAKDDIEKQELKSKIKDGTNVDIDPKEVIDQIEEFKRQLQEKDYKTSRNQEEKAVRSYIILAMLGLATGRRFTELLKTFNIEKRGTKITFSGLLKGNDKELRGHIISLTYKEVKKYLTELRENLFYINKKKLKIEEMTDSEIKAKYPNEKLKTEDMTESEVNAKYAKVFNNALKRMGLVNVKSTRQKYSMAGSKLFKEDNETIEETITRILGHKEQLPPALNYTKEG